MDMIITAKEYVCAAVAYFNTFVTAKQTAMLHPKRELIID